MKVRGVCGFLVVYREGIGGTKARTWYERKQATQDDPRWLVPVPLKIAAYMGIARFFDWPPQDQREDAAQARFVDFIMDRVDDAALLTSLAEAREVLRLLPRDVYNYEIIYVENVEGVYPEPVDTTQWEFLGFDVGNLVAYSMASLIVYVHQYPVIHESELLSLKLNHNGLFFNEADAMEFYRRHIKLIGKPYRKEFAVMRVFRVPCDERT